MLEHTNELSNTQKCNYFALTLMQPFCAIGAKGTKLLNSVFFVPMQFEQTCTIHLYGRKFM